MATGVEIVGAVGVGVVEVVVVEVAQVVDFLGCGRSECRAAS